MGALLEQLLVANNLILLNTGDATHFHVAQALHLQ